MSAAAPDSSVTLTLYPVLDGYIGHTEISSKVIGVSPTLHQDKVQNVILLDRSMSMGTQTKRLVTKVFPQVLRRMDADASAKLTVIGFDDEAVFVQATAKELEKTNLRARGGTVMSSAINMLDDYVQKSYPLPKGAAVAPAPARDLLHLSASSSSSSSPASASSASPEKKKHKVEKDNEFSPYSDPLRKAPRELRAEDTLEIDVAFIVDCTASMGSWIASVKQTIFKLVEQVKTECQTVRDAPAKVRIAFVAYRDYFDGSDRFASLDFTEDVNKFHAFVSKQGAIGGDDGPEDMFGGLHKGLELSWSTTAHTRIALLVADAPCHWHGYGDSDKSLKFADPFKPVDKQERLVHAYALKNINLSFTKINTSTDDMMTKFQQFYYDDEKRKCIKILQLGQKVERFLPSVLGMISATALGDGNSSPNVFRQIPEKAEPVSQYLRILAISDGELEDMHATMNAAAKLQTTLADRFVVNAQAVRFFTSADQPDTKGLSSVLQLNSVVPAQLIDLDASAASDEEIAKQLVELLEKDGLAHSFVLSSPEQILQSSPWSNGQSTLSLVKGSNTFWLKKVPEKLVLDGGIPVKIQMATGHFDEDTYNRIMGAKIEYFMQRLRVLKVVDDAASANLLKTVTDYFERLDAFVVKEQVAALQGGVNASSSSGASIGYEGKSLRTRMAVLRMQLAKKKTSVAQRMKEIANDERIGKLNSKQAAEYLRNVSSSSKAVARRAEKAGLEFDEKVVNELQNIAKHIDQLDDIDDSKHTKSFYSQETTLGGVRSLAELYNAERLNMADISVEDVLPILNIVGVACKALVGDFVDPMTWRIEKLYPSSPISLSDILQARLASGGRGPAPIEAADQEIINVVPLFDDQRIHQFLKKYAPSLLEYNASVGMRRIVAGIPMTHSYTIAAGVWAMVFSLNCADRKSHQIQNWTNLLDTFRVAFGRHFDHVLPYVRKEVTNDGLSFYIANNGITNMISPLMTLIKEKNGLSNCNNIGAILRALYTFEIRQAVKRYVKKRVPAEDKDKADIYATRLLAKLLGINESNKAKLPEMFIEELPVPSFPDQPVLDQEELNSIISEFWYLDHVCLLPAFLDAAQQQNPAEAFAKIPVLDEEYCRKALQLEEGTTLTEFKLLNIVQAVLAPSKASRVDNDLEKMKIPDLVDTKRAREEISAYIRKQYMAMYDADMVQRGKEERAIILKKMVSFMRETEDMDKFKQLLSKGYKRARAKVRIEGSSSYGFIELKSALVDSTRAVSRRLEKVAILLLGRDRATGETVWNNGNSLYVTDPAAFDAAFVGDDAQGWNKLKLEHRATYKHGYRDSDTPNHHGHSQSKPSFWGRGFTSLEDMQRGVSADEWREYQKLHSACCGFKQYQNRKVRRAAIADMIAHDEKSKASSSH